MAKKKSVNKTINDNTYEFFTLDRKNVDDVLKKIDAYFRKNGRTVVGENN